MLRQKAFFPCARDGIGLADRHRSANRCASRQRNLQEIEDRTDGRLVILAEFFVFDSERIDADPSEKALPSLLLLRAVFKTSLNQVGIELRLAPSRFPFLHFPKVSLNRTRL